MWLRVCGFLGAALPAASLDISESEFYDRINQ